MNASPTSPLAPTVPATFYRLNPHLNARPRATSMFDVAKATGLRLINGRHWGDDYLETPQDPETRALVEELLRGDGIFFEPVSELPWHLRGLL